jgi:hypothetical protein
MKHAQPAAEQMVDAFDMGLDHPVIQLNGNDAQGALGRSSAAITWPTMPMVLPEPSRADPDLVVAPAALV